MQRLIYQEGSGYRSEVGGLMEALRALDVQQSMYVTLASHPEINLIHLKKFEITTPATMFPTISHSLLQENSLREPSRFCPSSRMR